MSKTMGLYHFPKIHRPSRGYNGGPNTFPPRHPERLAARIEAGRKKAATK